ncbi:MAG: ABC transporter substrate-binding protein [Actinomycetota bacterium]
MVALVLVVAACGDDAATTTTTAAAQSCEIADLNLVTPGQLTVATGEPAFPPWVGTPDGENFDVPESGTGFEAALVYALADELGFTHDQVVWVRTGFDEAIAPGTKDFDFNVQQYTITADREQVVDFSDPYYSNAQALVAFPDSAVAGATTFADLKDAKLGVQVGTTSLDYIEQVIQPTTQAAVYDTTVDAKAALEAEQIDGLVVDVATAYYITAVEIEGSVIVAQFATPASAPDEFGLLFAEGNPLRTCVNLALGALRTAGTLDSLADQWLVDAGGLAVISG